MSLIEIIVIILVVTFLSLVIGGNIYKKKKKPKGCSGDCCGCSGCVISKSSLIERYRKDYPKA